MKRLAAPQPQLQLESNSLRGAFQDIFPLRGVAAKSA